MFTGRVELSLLYNVHAYAAYPIQLIPFQSLRGIPSILHNPLKSTRKSLPTPKAAPIFFCQHGFQTLSYINHSRSNRSRRAHKPRKYAFQYLHHLCSYLVGDPTYQRRSSSHVPKLHPPDVDVSPKKGSTKLQPSCQTAGAFDPAGEV